MTSKIKIASESRRFAWLLLFAGSLVRFQAQGLVTIGFEGPPILPTESTFFVEEYTETLFWFQPLGLSEPGNGFIRNSGDIPQTPVNGSAFLQTPLGASIQFGHLDGDPFDFVSVDLAEYSTVVPDAATVQFVGYFADGGTIMQSFTTDGIIDGTGPLTDFQTFAFGAGWTGLSRVEVPGFGWSLDNVVVGVPEPTAGALLLLGGGLLWGTRRWKCPRF